MGNSNIVQGELVVGRISAVHGVRGWVKIKSFTELAETIFDYQPWLIEKNGITHKVEIDAWKRQGDGLIVISRALTEMMHETGVIRISVLRQQYQNWKKNFIGTSLRDFQSTPAMTARAEIRIGYFIARDRCK